MHSVKTEPSPSRHVVRGVMQALRRSKNTTAKGLTALSVVLLLGVLRHVSRVTKFVSVDSDDENMAEFGGRRSLFFRAAQTPVVLKQCLPDVSIEPPALPAGSSAMADIKRIMTDWKHITQYVQSCAFESQHSAKQPGSKTRGILIPSAGHAMFAHTWVVVTILRETLGCTLPIEVAYNGEDELDVNLSERLKVDNMATMA